jgi:hypothetical protein
MRQSVNEPASLLQSKRQFPVPNIGQDVKKDHKIKFPVLAASLT